MKTIEIINQEGNALLLAISGGRIRLVRGFLSEGDTFTIPNKSELTRLSEWVDKELKRSVVSQPLDYPKELSPEDIEFEVLRTQRL